MDSSVEEAKTEQHSPQNIAGPSAADGLSSVPAELRKRDQWVLWKFEARDGKPSKVPYSANGQRASTADRSTWAGFEKVVAQYRQDPNQYAGIGFMFTNGGGLTGVDLDGCRNPTTGAMDEWAQRIIDQYPGYWEVSPSQTGVKGYFIGSLPTEGTGKNHKLGGEGHGGKAPGIEMYHHRRYFCVTGQRLECAAEDLTKADLTPLWNKYFAPAAKSTAPGTPTLDFARPVGAAAQSTTADGTAKSVGFNFATFDPDQHLRSLTRTPEVLERAAKYLATMDPAISGDNGSDRLYRAVAKMYCGFGLSPEDTKQLILELYNPRCVPQWSEAEIDHKIESVVRKEPVTRELLFELWDPSEHEGGATEGGVASASSKEDRQIKFLTSAELDQADLSVRYHIAGVLPVGQPFIFGGPDKCLKTTLAISMMMSIASCSDDDWCGYKVETPGKVMFLSGESGLAKIRQTAREIAASRSKSLSDYSILWASDIYDFTSFRDLDVLKLTIEKQQITVVVIDPAYLYLSALGESSANIFASGEVLRELTKLCQQTGATIGLLHHFRKSGDGEKHKFNEPELSWLSGSAFGAWARSWILINRRSAYDPEMKPQYHELWMNVGGSAGHSHRWAVDVWEGVGPMVPFKIDKRSAKEEHEEAKRLKQSKGNKLPADEQHEQNVAEGPPNAMPPGSAQQSGESRTPRDKMLAVLRQHPAEWRSKTALGNAAKLSGKDAKAVLQSLEREKLVESREGRLKDSREWRLMNQTES